MAYWDAALDRVRQVPGVSGAALVSVAPFSGVTAIQRVQPSQSGARMVQRNEVSSTYFDTIGMRVVRGRAFTAEEVASGARVPVISASLARQYWGNSDPLGSTLDRVWGAPDEQPSVQRKPAGTRVVGVVNDAIVKLQRSDLPMIYLPFFREFGGAAHMLVSTKGDPQIAARAVTGALTALDPNRQPQVALVRDGFNRELELPRVLSTGALALGASALLLAVIGLFGVTAFIVGQRRHEISIRMALGASAGEVVRMLVRQSLRPVVIGAACGLLVAFGAGQLIAGVLVGISGHDPLAIGAAITVLVSSNAAFRSGPHFAVSLGKPFGLPTPFGHSRFSRISEDSKTIAGCRRQKSEVENRAPTSRGRCARRSEEMVLS